MHVVLVRVPFDIKHPRCPPKPPILRWGRFLFSFQAATPKTVEQTPQERPSRSLEDVDSPLDGKRKISTFIQIIPFRPYWTIHIKYKHPFGNITSHIEFLSPWMCHGLSRGRTVFHESLSSVVLADRLNIVDPHLQLCSVFVFVAPANRNCLQVVFVSYKSMLIQRRPQCKLAWRFTDVAC